MNKYPDRVDLVTDLKDLLVKSWFRYDKKITSVLRTMGYNSVKQYEKSGQNKTNYFKIMSKIKEAPDEKTLYSLLSHVKETINSTNFKAMLWIEDNVTKYNMKQHGEGHLDSIAENMMNLFSELEKIPHVKKVTPMFKTETHFAESSVLGEKSLHYIRLQITYDQDITYIPKNNGHPYKIRLAGRDGINQLIQIPLKEINLKDVFNKNVAVIMPQLLTEKVFRENFKFSGPCMFISNNYRSSTPSAGCLGSLSEDFNDVCKSGNINRYISFISGWSTTYAEGNTHPYTNPGQMIERYRVRGFAEGTPRGMLNEDNCAVYEGSSNATHRRWCNKCVINQTCSKSLVVKEKTHMTETQTQTYANILWTSTNGSIGMSERSFDVSFKDWLNATITRQQKEETNKMEDYLIENWEKHEIDMGYLAKLIRQKRKKATK